MSLHRCFAHPYDWLVWRAGVVLGPSLCKLGADGMKFLFGESVLHPAVNPAGQWAVQRSNLYAIMME